MAARVLRNPELRRAADAYDRAARAQYGQIPRPSREGSQLRAAARLMALTGPATGDATLVTVVLIANLVALAVAVAELREAQQLAAQSAAARRAAMQLRAASLRVRSRAPYPGQRKAPRRSRTANAPDLARSDVATSWRPSVLHCWPRMAWPQLAPSTTAQTARAGTVIPGRVHSPPDRVGERDCLAVGSQCPCRSPCRWWRPELIERTRRSQLPAPVRLCANQRQRSG